MKNKLTDLNDHLFKAMERLNNDALPQDQIATENERVKGVIGLSTQIISSAKVTLDAIKLVSEGTILPNQMPDMLGIDLSVKKSELKPASKTDA